MNRRPGAADVAGWTRDASPHRITNPPVSAGVPNLRTEITMTNRKCIHVR
jgi:hypothetical protein